MRYYSSVTIFLRVLTETVSEHLRVNYLDMWLGEQRRILCEQIVRYNFGL